MLERGDGPQTARGWAANVHGAGLLLGAAQAEATAGQTLPLSISLEEM